MVSDVAPVLGRGGADAVAVSTDPTAPAVVLSPLIVAEQAASSVVGATQPAEGLVSPVQVVVTVPSQEQPDAAAVVSEGAVQSVSPEAQAEGTATTASPEQLDAATVESEGAAQSVPPAV